MIIKFLTSELQTEQKGRRQLLIGKIWKARDAYNFLTGVIGTKKRGMNWNFSEVTLHPEDRIYIKFNKWKQGLRDPEFLLYVENQPNGSKLSEKKPV